jgi:DNA-binding MarR family transcriptional regulator
VSDVKEPHLVALFDLVWRRVKDEMEAGPIIEGAELRPSQRRVLGRTPLEGIRVTALAERAQMTAQALGTIAEVLVLAGYLERVPDPHDRRAKLLRLTESGRRVRESGLSKMADLEARWRSELGDLRWRELRSTLTALARINEDERPAS